MQLRKKDLDSRLEILEAVSLHSSESVTTLNLIVLFGVIPSKRQNLMITEAIKRFTNLEKLMIGGTMPFLLDEIVQAAREANAFNQVNDLELALDGAYTERRIFEFMSLFNPAALVKLRVVNTLPELYSILTALHFKLKSLEI